MVDSGQRFRLANEPGSLGLSCKQTGLALAGVPLLRETGAGFVPRPPCEIDILMKAAYSDSGTRLDLLPELTSVANALNDGNLAKAMTFATLLKLNKLDWNRAVRIAQADNALSKYNSAEFRDWHGRWTTGDDNNSPQTTVPESELFTDVAYQGVYHDQVVAELAAFYRHQGARVLTSVNLIARNGATARADLMMVPSSGKPLILVEVKTGNDPQYTNGQRVVYPMAQIGDHVYSPDSKISQLGFAPTQWLPPIRFITIYKKNDRSPFRWIIHPSPIIP